MKKKLLFGLSLVAVAAATVGVTYAVLQDETPVAVNVMTVGNVSIEQLEYQRKDKSVHVTSYAHEGDLIPFADKEQVVLPSISKNWKATDYTAEQTDLYCWGDYVTKTENVGCNGLWNPEKVENVIDKFVMVKNTGSTDAYFRTLVAVELPEGMTIGEIPQGDDIMMNVNNGWYTYEYIGYIPYEGNRYALMTFTYDKNNNGILTAGETARPSLLQFLFSDALTNEDLEQFGNDGFKVLVATQAVQATNLMTPSEALNDAFGEITENNHPFKSTN